MLRGGTILSLIQKGWPHMTLTSELTALRNQSRDLAIDERAELACQAAKRLEKIGEYDAGQLSEAFHFYNEVAPLLEASEDDAIKGCFHDSFAALFTKLITTDHHNDHIDQALIEYAAASFHFEQAGNTRYLARVENNLGYLFFTIGNLTMHTSILIALGTSFSN